MDCSTPGLPVHHQLLEFTQTHRTGNILDKSIPHPWIAFSFPRHSVQFSRSVMSDSSQPHEPQPARPPCPSPTPGVYTNSCPLSRWCHPTISSSVVPFSSRLQSFPASGSFQMSQFFTLGGQIIGLSASASVLPMNIFRTDFLEDGLVGPPCSPRDTQEPYPAPQFKSINSLALSFLYSPTLTFKLSQLFLFWSTTLIK